MRLVLTEASKGNFRTAAVRLKTLNVNSSSAIQVVIACCAACNNSTLSLEPGDLCDILKLSVSLVTEDNIKENFLDNYLQSLFYIVKFLLAKDCAYISSIESVILPGFLTQLTDSQASVYLNVSKAVYNYVVGETRKKAALEIESLLELSQISLKIVGRTMSPGSLLEWFHRHLLIYNVANADSCMINLQYKNTFNLMRNIERKTDESYFIFKTSINILKTVLYNFVKQKCVLDIETTLDMSLNVINQFCNTKELICCYKIIKRTHVYISNLEKPKTQTILTETIAACNKDLKMAQKLFGFTENMVSTCELLASIFWKLYHNYFRSISPEEWQRIRFNDSLLSFLQLFKKLTTFAEFAHETCCKCDKSNLFHVGLIAALSGHIIKLSLLNKTEVSELVITELLTQMQEGCSHVCMLKEKKCPLWEDCWNETGSVMYNLGVILYKLNNAQCVEFFNTFVETLIKLEGTEKSVIRDDILDSCLSCLTEIYFKNQNHRKAMTLTALRVWWCKNNRQPAILQWIRAKSANSDVKELTLTSILRLESSVVKKFCPDLQIENKTRAELLVFELESYKRKWPSKLPMMSAFRELLETCESKFCAKIFIQTWTTTFLTAHDEIPNLLNVLLEKLKPQSSPEINLLTACLYYSQFKCTMGGLVAENIAQMEKNLVSPLKSAEIPVEDPSHPNDECDIAAYQEHLTCNGIMKQMKILIKALNIIEQNTSGKVGESVVRLIHDVDLIGVVFKIGNEFRVHLNVALYMRAFKLALILAKITNDNSAMLESISFLLERLDLTASSAQELLNAPNFIIAEMEETVDALKVITNFYINKSFAFLYHENVDECVAAYEQAKNYFGKSAALSNDVVLQVRFKHLTFKLAMLPCNLNVSDHKGHTLITIHEALTLIVKYFKGEGQKCAYTLSVLFDIISATSHMYKWLRMPRELRCYTKEVTDLAQRLLVPLRAAQFLVFLAHADLQTLRFADAQVKIDGISNILCVQGQKMAYLRVPNLVEKVEKEVNVDDLRLGVQEMTLDLPRKVSTCPSSPEFYRQPFVLPEFTKHNAQCKCFMCGCREYQGLVLMKIHLEALINGGRGEEGEVVREYFLGAFKLFEWLSNNSVDEFMESTNWCFYEAFSSVLLDYVEHMKTTNPKEAENVNDELLTFVRKRKLQNLHLHNEALLQRVELLWKDTPTYDNLNTKEPAATSTTLEKTPENQTSTIAFKKPPTPSFEPLPKRYVKGKHLVFSDDEEQTPKTPLKPKRTRTKPTKFEIYTPMKSTKKQPQPLSPIALPQPNADSLNSNAPPKVESGLKSKTKLLTERIKRSTINDKPVVICTDENGAIIAEKKSAVKKNLMEELGDGESKVQSVRKGVNRRNPVEKGGVRKSSRTVQK